MQISLEVEKIFKFLNRMNITIMDIFAFHYIILILILFIENNNI